MSAVLRLTHRNAAAECNPVRRHIQWYLSNLTWFWRVFLRHSNDDRGITLFANRDGTFGASWRAFLVICFSATQLVSQFPVRKRSYPSVCAPIFGTLLFLSNPWLLICISFFLWNNDLLLHSIHRDGRPLIKCLFSNIFHVLSRQ